MKARDKSTFALLFGNRGFFSPELIAEAREQLPRVLEANGHQTLMLDADATRYGAISNPEEARIYADFLKANEGKYQGIILSLPNFGEEASLVEALRKATVPIFIHAYPDELKKMKMEQRRDSFCGKFSVMDIFYQYGLKYTSLEPHVVDPEADEFAENIEHFDKVCRVTNGLKDMAVGAVGARTTAFKTVRVDELALQKNGITMEVVDLSEVLARIKALKQSSPECREKADNLKKYTTWQGVPEEAFNNLVKLAVVLDNLFLEWNLDAMALRCWIELQRQLNVSPCVLLSEMNDRKMTVACEVDVPNAITMYALQMASGKPAACLDWNNNYGNEKNKCILFHCGSTAQSLMTSKGRVVDHLMLQHDPQVGPNCSFSCNEGRITSSPFAFGSMTTRDGDLNFYLGQGRFTNDPIPDEFFGCAGVAEIQNLQSVLLHVGRNGHRHHVSITPGERLVQPIKEALEYYLGYNVETPQTELREEI